MKLTNAMDPQGKDLRAKEREGQPLAVCASLKAHPSHHYLIDRSIHRHRGLLQSTIRSTILDFWGLLTTVMLTAILWL